MPFGGKAGLALLGPFGVGLLGSSVLIQRKMAAGLSDPSMAARIFGTREFVILSSWMLLGSVVVVCAVAVWLARQTFRNS